MKFLNAGSGHRREVLNMRILLLNTFFIFLVSLCAAQQSVISIRSPLSDLLADTTFKSAHIGVSVYDVNARKFLFNYQGDKYFVPASNVKIATCYAAMKYIGQTITGIKYFENDTAVYLIPTGDPTLLHRDYNSQPVIDFLKSVTKKIYITTGNWKEIELGQGWSWDDYNDEYMTERNPLPVYGNTLKWVQEKMRSNDVTNEESFSIYSDPEVNWKVKFTTDSGTGKFRVMRDRAANVFTVTQGTEFHKEVVVPFITGGVSSSLELLADTIGRKIEVTDNFFLTNVMQRLVPSQPTDSVLRPMMYRSDNFFAEQILLNAAEAKCGTMTDQLIIDTVLSHLSNKVVWVDGSGLSRYNLFTPKAFVEILDSMRVQFGMERIKTIFPQGDSGTLKNYYVGSSGKIYAKTGSMSGVLALSGFIYGKGNRLLIFSILINNYNGAGANGRQAIERFVKKLF
jgi:D-alanyl-D-alanine carboxypeptidase/D-alanyl-D-alanine-endopeptidase (penicillin-binding protein 4)